MFSRTGVLTGRIRSIFVSHRTAYGAGVVGAAVAINQSRAMCSAQVEPTTQLRPTIYQYLTCPFCNRVKSYLDYCGIEYDTVEVNPLTKSEISKLQGITNKKVPIAVIDGRSVEDSKAIIDEVIKVSKDKKLASYPGDNFFPADTEHWMDWSEKKLAVMLYPNITRSWDESWECFGYSENVASWNWFEQKLVRVAGTAAMTIANGKIKKKYGIDDERAALKQVVDEWVAAVGGKTFLHGEKPTMPDVIVYGVFRSIDGLKTFHEIMNGNAALKQWYGNVQDAVAHNAAQKVKSTA